ncbi:MAG: Rieske 2Fe-2S domain-containing protein, partial [Candidatus Eremiobacteraeota bacterium]|nr:Rieske 2Fe-2S domain-containing protein [Candidatus Eremiobacteraeota bacterium]
MHFSGSRVSDGLDYVRVGHSDEIRPGHSRAYRVGQYDVAVFNVSGQLHAIENVCPHQGAPLTDGWMDG